MRAVNSKGVLFNMLALTPNQMTKNILNSDSDTPSAETGI